MLKNKRIDSFDLIDSYFSEAYEVALSQIHRDVRLEFVGLPESRVLLSLEVNDLYSCASSNESYRTANGEGLSEADIVVWHTANCEEVLGVLRLHKRSSYF